MEHRGSDDGRLSSPPRDPFQHRGERRLRPPPERRAPLGVPVVPEVSSTVRPGDSGRSWSAGRGAARSVRRACAGRPSERPGRHARPSPRRGRPPGIVPPPAAVRTPRRTPPGWRARRSSTSPSCGPGEAGVEQQRVSADPAEQRSRISTRPRWLRHRIPSVPERSPSSPCSATAAASLRRSSSAPGQRATFVDQCGRLRAADGREADAGHRVRALPPDDRACRRYLSGPHRRDHPAGRPARGASRAAGRTAPQARRTAPHPSTGKRRVRLSSFSRGLHPLPYDRVDLGDVGIGAELRRRCRSARAPASGSSWAAAGSAGTPG